MYEQFFIYTSLVGHGDESDRVKPTFVKVMQGKTITKCSMGNAHTLCMENNGTVWAFGGNAHGQLGINSQDKNSLKAVVVDFGQYKIKEICCGSLHSGAITQEGQIYTWGCGADGQCNIFVSCNHIICIVGHNDKNNRAAPTVVFTLTNVKMIQLSLGLWHSLALSENNTVYSWGNSSYGQCMQRMLHLQF